MVWGLFPVDPLPGEDQYYIFSKGIYKVGRKGCHIIINKDKGVSRIHAEIIIDEMICMDHVTKKSSNISSKVRIRDCSKYGTFIKKNLGMKEKVHEGPNKEIMLNDGDLISFGTDNATYRFCFISLVFFMLSSNLSEMNQLQEKISMIGASVARSWSLQCTHMVIDNFVSTNDQLIDAILAKNTLVRYSWIEFIAGKTICTEIPSSHSHAPNLMLEGVSVKVTDAHSREHCLRGYTFLLESIHKYKFKEQLQSLLDVGGAKVVFFETLDPDSQSLGETNDHVVRVIPTGVTSSNKSFHNFDSAPKVKEIELISAVFSGHLDPSIMVSAPGITIYFVCKYCGKTEANSSLSSSTASSKVSPNTGKRRKIINMTSGGSGRRSYDTAKWSMHVEHVFVDLMYEQVLKGNIYTTSFSPLVWSDIMSTLFEMTGTMYEIKQLKGKHYRLKETWRKYHDLMVAESGIGWNAESNMPQAEPIIWEELAKSNPIAAVQSLPSLSKVGRGFCWSSCNWCQCTVRQLKGLQSRICMSVLTVRTKPLI